MNKRERKKKIMERKIKINKIREKYCTYKCETKCDKGEINENKGEKMKINEIREKIKVSVRQNAINEDE